MNWWSYLKSLESDQIEISVWSLGHCREIGDNSTSSFIQVALLQYNLNGSNTDGSFTVDGSNSFFIPYKILLIAQENKYLMIFFFFIMELYVMCTH